MIPASSLPAVSSAEHERLAVLRDYDILDSVAEHSFDQLVALAAQVFDAPMSAISLLDADRQWFKARLGIDPLETPRDISFCTHAIDQPGPLVVPDASRDPRFAHNPLVTGDMGIRFYAGMPLVTPTGHALGTLCVIDRRAHEVSARQLETLRTLAGLAMELLEQRRLIRRQRQIEVERIRMRAERDQLVAAASAREAWFRGILDALPVAAYTCDADGLITYFNENAVDAWGRRAELHHPADRFTGCRELVDSTGATVLPEETWMARALRERRPQLNREISRRLPDGSFRYFLANASPLSDAAGQLTGAVNVLIDITEKKNAGLELDRLLRESETARAALAASEQRYRELFEKHPHPLWVYDVETLAFLDVNAAALAQYGYSRAEFLGMSIKDIRPPEDVPALLAEVRATEVRNGAARRTEWRHRRRDGKIITVAISSHQLLVEGRAARLVLARDVTEEKSLQDQFLRAQRMENLGLLAAGVAHDLNNILTPMMMIAPLLGQRLTSESDQRLLTTVEHSVRRGAGLVKQITSFARGAGNELGAVQVKHLARDIAAFVGETFPRSIRFVPEIGADLPAARANATQVHQIMLNLCVNARDAMPDGGELRLRVVPVCLDESAAAAVPHGRPGSFVLIEVTDTGTGIPPEIVERIWEPFFTTKPEGKGTGLGLATVWGIVARHEGFINLESWVGRGTTFRVYLPADESEQTGRGGTRSTVPPCGQGECVLFVDDEPDIRTFAQTALAQHGYRPLVASGGAQALTIFREHQEDIRLVITDHHMPGLKGDELIAALRIIRPTLPVLICSGSSGREWPGLFKDEMLLKPFEPKTLLTAIRQVLRN